MRLVDVITLELVEFVEGKIPPYACLSHRWSDEEVSYQQWQDRTPAIQSRKGYLKVIGTCEIALSHGNMYLWADTCCIDKTSSAELSEAINSMWTWYSMCSSCLVLLADIDGDQQRSSLGYAEELNNSEWFSRAWTLQELLAPSSVSFYDCQWRFLGTKYNLVRDIQAHTDIHPKALIDFKHSDWSIAQRMSWASMRKATRSEDIAYSLLGIFDINMPMLYGEGKKAFTRLQEEIIRHSIDTSILAWDPVAWNPPLAMSDTEKSSLLAPHPVCFRNGRSRTGLFSQLQDIPNSAHMSVLAFSTITNLGLDVTLPLSPLHGSERRALVAFESPSRERQQPLHRRGCFICLERVHGDDLMQRMPVELYSKFLSAPDQPATQELELTWCKITIASKPYQRTGLAQDRYSLKSYVYRTGPKRNVWRAPNNKISERAFLSSGYLATNGSSPFETVGVWLSEDVESPMHMSYTVQFGFDSGHSPTILISHSPAPITQLKADAEAGASTLFSADWMLFDVDMTQHESKAFSWLDYNKNKSEGVLLSFYSRRGFRINWKAVALHLEPWTEDENGLTWSLGIQNSVNADAGEASRNAIGQIEVDSVLHPRQDGLVGSIRQLFSR